LKSEVVCQEQKDLYNGPVGTPGEPEVRVRCLVGQVNVASKRNVRKETGEGH
jgi:hypothetical protein